MKKYLISLMVLGFFAGTYCQEKIDIEADIEANKNLTEEWDATFNAGDLDGHVSLYTDDAVSMQPNMPALVGKNAIRDSFQSFYEQNTEIEFDDTNEEVIVCGDWAFVWGTYTETYTPKVGGETIRDSGKWMDFRKRQPDGSWRIYRTIWNSDLPPSGVN